MYWFYALFIVFGVMLFVRAEPLSIIPAQYIVWTFLKCQLINLSALLSSSPPSLLHGDAVRHHFLFESLCTFIALKFCSCPSEVHLLLLNIYSLFLYPWSTSVDVYFNSMFICTFVIMKKKDMLVVLQQYLLSGFIAGLCTVFDIFCWRILCFFPAVIDFVCWR